MFGTKIGRLLKNSGKKERIQFWFASMVTVTATLLYTMFAFGLSDITNDSLSKNDVQQLQGVLSSVILISIIAVMFFQWILATQLQNLFNIRKHFTEALLLMGTPHKNRKDICFRIGTGSCIGNFDRMCYWKHHLYCCCKCLAD